MPTIDSPGKRPTWAEIDLSAVTRNYLALRRLLEAGPPDAALSVPKVPAAPLRRLIPVVKADAYGHGAIAISRALAEAGADVFAVALSEEGVALREAGLQSEIIVLEGAWPGQEEALAARGLTAAVHDPEGIRRLDARALKMNRTVPVHLKIDTGMARLGAPWDRLETVLGALRSAAGLKVTGAFSHLACAEEEDPAFTLRQIGRFQKSVSLMRAQGLDPADLHLANSAGLIHWPALRGLSARPGIALYGYPPAPGRCPVELAPVMTVKSRVGRLHELRPGESVGYNKRFTAHGFMRVATIPIGYADGYRRDLSGRARVIIRDTYADVLGAVSMDMIVVDVTGIPGVEIGEEVVLLGSTRRCRVNAADWSAWLGTIPYEVLCGIGPRVPRILTGSAGES